MNPAWREFELLVARIEAVLAPLGATVTSSARVPDRISGNLREVDATIRYTADDRELLITLECRDRQSAEDNTWIEQLVTKQRSIAADKTIAVSSRGFSEPALRKAAYFGIDARTMLDIKPEDAMPLLKLHFHETCYCHVLRDLKIVLWTDGPGDPPPLTPEVTSILKTNLRDAPVFQRVAGSPTSWREIWRFIESRDFAQIYDGVPSDGSRKHLLYRVKFSDDVFIETISGLRRVVELHAQLELYMEQRAQRMSVDRTAEYATQEAVIAQAVSYSAEASLAIAVTAITPSETGQTHLTVQVAPKTGA